MDTRLEIEDAISDGGRRLILSGELDLATAPIMWSRLEETCSEAAQHLTLDLTNLAFMDSSGIYTVLRADALCRSRRLAFSVVAGNGPVRRLFEVVGLLGAGFVEPDAASAA
jgi:anti-anti-sigma factor